MIINCWQNILSPHQSAYLRALAEFGHDVHLFVEQEELLERRAMGWPRPDFGHVRISVAPSDAEVMVAIDRGLETGACHIVSGIRGTPLSTRVLAAVHARGARLGILAEPGDPRGLRGWLRKGLYARDAQRWSHVIDFILAMGQTGVDWYTSVGYPVRKVFHFGYVVETPIVDTATLPLQRDVQIMYVGSLIKLKGIELLLNALASAVARVPEWQLHLIGDGQEREALRRLAELRGIKPRVQFHGILPMPGVLQLVAQADLLVLPSRSDGWGAVVNEALMCGIPVICSNQCGAADLLRAPWLGDVFRSGSAASLQRVLTPRLQQGPLAPETRTRIRAWSRCIGGETMARYLLTVLDHVYAGGTRPSPPWHLHDHTAHCADQRPVSSLHHRDTERWLSPGK